MNEFQFQATIKNARKKRALKEETSNTSAYEKEENKKVKDILNLIMAHSFLKAEDIPDTFTLIYESVHNDVENGGIYLRLTNFLKYFIKQWLVLRPPTEWSLSDIIRMTNNGSESTNRTICSFFGDHPVPRDFVRKST